jgi:hypothetical protein
MHGIRGDHVATPPEYLVIAQVLGRRRGRERERMYRALDLGRAEIDAAIARLERVGVLTVGGKTVRASRPSLV